MTRKTRSVFEKIGNEKVYRQQLEIADDVMKLLFGSIVDGVRHRRSSMHLRSPVIALQPQQGKTGVCIALITQFIDWCVRHQRTFQVVVLCGLPQTSLAKQTQRRMTSYTDIVNGEVIGASLDLKARVSGLSLYPGDLQNQGILVSHNTKSLIKHYADLPKVRVDERLIIVDEQHLGNNRDGNLDTFLRSCGIKMSEQIHTWEKVNGTDNHVVGVSATPFAHIILSKMFATESSSKQLEGDTLFDIVYREPGDTYNSIKRMLENGRLRESEALFSDGGPSLFLRSVEAEFNKSCKRHGPGYLVIRATGPLHARLKEYINRQGHRLEVKAFDSEEGNIDHLNDFLGRKPKLPTWVLIRASMRAGMTLPGDHYIRAWVESTSDNCDAQIQAGLGRACGYGRDKDTYPVYCHLKSANKAVAIFDDLGKGRVGYVPAGRQNTTARPRKQYDCQVMGHSEAKALRDAINSKKRNLDKLQISTISGNIATDLAEKLLRMRPDSSTTFGFFVDRASKAFPESWARLIGGHPEWVGKVVRFIPRGTAKELAVDNIDEYHKKHSALKKTSALKSSALRPALRLVK